nr:beta-ketoacyl-[acyl-carrier-protein] synthase family protein [uncultured Desulfobulbus sp.]
MSKGSVFIAAAGIISPLGCGLEETEAALRDERSAIAPLDLFALLQGSPLPAGQVRSFASVEPQPPRAHQLACKAAEMALEGQSEPPDAIVVGCTTGGILTTETLLRQQESSPGAYRAHGLLSLAEEIATLCHCSGPALTVSTACSSGAVAIGLALNLLRSGQARRVLAGGVDSLSRLTYYGFHSLQLVDRNGCRPLDATRQGLAVAEGAGMLLLTVDPPDKPLATLMGAGFSCDAYHPTAPHPEGKGARAAMAAALADAGLAPEDIDYINLHGTGTPDNDLAETRAIASLFSTPPPLSSIKGATGHSLAASGALEAVVSSLCVSRSLVPGTVGCKQPDPAFGFTPQLHLAEWSVETVLSNSFGFGGNNGCLVIGAGGSTQPIAADHETVYLAVHGTSCLTGAGLLPTTFARLQEGEAVAGQLPDTVLAEHLPPRQIRRVKRLARLALLLAQETVEDTRREETPGAVFMGTGWGALSETWDFLDRLTSSGEQFPSPTDFVGSVHNSPAGQVAMRFQATGANVTVSGGDYSFEQALLAAQTLLPQSGQSALLIGADEGHAQFSPLLDRSVAAGPLSDGGGALYVNRDWSGAQCLLRLAFYGRGGGRDLPEQMLAALGGMHTLQEQPLVVFAGLPAAGREEGEEQLRQFLALLGAEPLVWRYRSFTGEFASASAVAAALAVQCLEVGFVPGSLIGGQDLLLPAGSRILVLGTGQCLTAMECVQP